ncbi:hypothetical protein DCAR_0104433 [Daucus carota subsp. sativus]|uniref:Uncharacterized protein n=1 Tax=Daucus carota subsp. sativus TaxID=79200 RepID=A0A166IUA6_DAUCS|nr:hypothetical protein DCAR_0104433 [Daucus carota subsp. sativus]
MADGFNLPGRKRNKENAADGSFSGIREYAGGRALDSFLQKRAENIKKSRTNPPGFAPVEGSLQNSSGSNRSPLSTVDHNSPLGFVMGTTTKGSERTPVGSTGPNNAAGHVNDTQERGNKKAFCFASYGCHCPVMNQYQYILNERITHSTTLLHFTHLSPIFSVNQLTGMTRLD